MRHQDEGRAVALQRPHLLEAPLLEGGVAHREHLVDQEHVGFEERGDREPETHLHARRIELHLPVDRVLQLGEAHDVFEASRDLASAQAEQRAEHEDVLAPGELRMDPAAHLDQCTDAADDVDRCRRTGT